MKSLFSFLCITITNANYVPITKKIAGMFLVVKKKLYFSGTKKMKNREITLILMYNSYY